MGEREAKKGGHVTAACGRGRGRVTWAEEGRRCEPITPGGRGKEVCIRWGHVACERVFRFR